MVLAREPALLELGLRRIVSNGVQPHLRGATMRQWFRGLCLAGSLSTLIPGAAAAQDVESLKRELDGMRRQFESLRALYEQRLKALAERLQSLEAQQVPAAVPRAGAAPAPPVTGGARTEEGRRWERS
jgi:hypothetical protein